MRFDAGDFRHQPFDPFLQLVDRHRVEVLFAKSHQRIVGFAREEIFQVHGSGIVDPSRRSVNKPDVANLPSSMRAVVADGDGRIAIVDRPLPQPGPGEVLVRVAAAGVNRPDVLQRRGMYPPPPGAPDILGLEVAGEVVTAGEGAEALVGDKVCALVAGGGYAEYCAAPAGTCLRVPEASSLVEAAAMPETLFTVWVNLFERGFAADGDWVLVHGGTSGIGTMAIALGKLFGLKLIVTCGTDEKCARASGLGADAAVNYRTQDFVEEVHRVTDRDGVNIVMDMIGGDYVPRNLACLAEEGRHVSIAVQRGASAEIQIFDIMRRRLTLTGSTLRPRSVEFKTMVADEIARTVWPFVEGGRLRPVIDATFPLAQADAAHARMERGDHVGKIVLEVGE
jgi:NADPH2:quinone reductase